jgi:hypothetical protein
MLYHSPMVRGNRSKLAERGLHIPSSIRGGMGLTMAANHLITIIMELNMDVRATNEMTRYLIDNTHYPECETVEVVDHGKWFLSMQYGVAQRALNYIGDTDCSFITKGARMLQYNILAKGHPRYKSTIGYKHNF